MTPIEMMRVVVSDVERITAMIDSGPCGFVLHTADFTRFLCHDVTDDIVHLSEPGESHLYVMRTPRAALTMQNYWNSVQTNESLMVSISLRRDALKRHLDGHLMLIEAIYEYNPNGAMQ